MKRWHKKTKSRATRAHGKCFVRTWRSFVNPFEDCTFKYNPNRKKGWAD